MRMLTPHDREAVRTAARDAMQFWPNAHLGDCSRREDLRSAFSIMRSWMTRAGYTVQQAAAYIARDAALHEDM